ncbi:MAG: ribosome maturation factor RimM [Clostridiales bacterium]|nr:ribosome maturation factor RimM [Clostridiales bacterium]
MQQYFEIGKIVNTHGIRGELKVIPLTDNISRYNDLEWVYVNKKGKRDKYIIDGVRYHKQNVLLKLQNVDNMSVAEEFKGLFIEVPRELAITLPENSYFISDLIGCVIVDENNKNLGILVEVLKTGSNDVYLIKNDLGKEILLPAIKDVVLNVDVDGKRIDVKLMEGLIDDED